MKTSGGEVAVLWVWNKWGDVWCLVNTTWDTNGVNLALHTVG